MIPLLILSLAVPLAIGFAWVQLFWPDRRIGGPDLPLKIALGWGFGAGISAGLYFLDRLLGWMGRSVTIGTEAVLLLALLGALALRGRQRQEASVPAELPSQPGRKGTLHWILVLIFGAELGTALVAFVLLSLKNPHGYWDAWAIWNLRARFLFRGGAFWRDGFSPLLAASHPDYPLLLPSLIARCWDYLGRESVAAPILVAMEFTFAGAGLVWASLSRMRSGNQGLLAGIVLLSAPYFIELGAIQYADIPLAFFMLATLALLCFQGQAPEPGKGLVLLTGMATGFTMWMKNEGLLFGLAILIVQAAALASGRSWKAGLHRALCFLGGLFPLAILLLYFKIRIAPPSEMVSALGRAFTAAQLGNLSRYAETLKAFAVGWITFGRGAIPALPILVLYLIAMGVHVEERNRRGATAALIVLGLVGTGYCFTYLVTPYDLRWHLTTSLSRLFMQLWPSFVFLFFLVTRPPEEALSHPPPG